jgi:cation-transporting ATPase F
VTGPTLADYGIGVRLRRHLPAVASGGVAGSAVPPCPLLSRRAPVDAARPEPWHHLPADRVAAHWQTDLTRGLGAEAAARRLAEHGRNVLSARRGHGPVVRFLLQFHQPLIYILLVATVVTALLDDWVDAAVILGVVLVNALVGFVQEGKALQAIEALGHTLVTEATVVRDGHKERIDSAEIVPGDLVLLQSGDKVPADLRLVRCRDLQVAEAALTGESVPVEKSLDLQDEAVPLADRRTMAYASTLVTFGQAAGVVVATGDDTEVGRISRLIAAADDIQTPLTRLIARFSSILLVVILALAAANFAIGTVVQGRSLKEMFKLSVALAVAAIPEGLPAAVTIMLAIGVARMAQRRAIIRKMPAVETLGSTTVICSDKTGTLTQNQMTVTEIVAGGETFAVTGAGYAPDGQILAGGSADGARERVAVSVAGLHGHVAVLECLRAGLLCNDSQVVHDEGDWSVEGDPTEAALLVAAAKAGLVTDVVQEEFPRVDSIPFESELQYMATLHDRGSDRPRLVYAKGAVEAILSRCGAAVDAAGQPGPLDADGVAAEVRRLAAAGLRVLAFARKELPPGTPHLAHDDVGNGLELLGLQAMIDPPRPEAITAVSICQRAGVRVKMITGDHALTAAAIAARLGIDGAAVAESGEAVAVTGQELERIADADLPNTAEGAAVFARVAPEQKLRLVRALQARGHVVAMTGDGVNDAPALKQADIGVAMGKGGTDVAREASDMVLTDDNFASIEAAVEEGRGVFDNLTKFIVWTLPTNGGEALTIIAAVLLGTSLPIAPVQILWVNMTTAILLGLMLAFEPKEPGIMDRQPRDPGAPLLSPDIFKRVGLVSLLLLCGAYGIFLWLRRVRQAELAEAQAAVATVFVVGEMFYLFNCRSLTRSMFAIGVFSNRPALYGALAMIALQVLFTTNPLMNRLFHTRPLGWETWLAIMLFGLGLYLVIELEKRLVGHALQGGTLRQSPGPSRPNGA